MAFIYRYHIKDKTLQHEVNLLNYKEEIFKAIENFYLSNLKDFKVEKEYYEYKLHKNIDNTTLREFGKYMVKNSKGLTMIWKNRKNKNNKTFFIRNKQGYYAFINTDKEENIKTIELIDVIDFENLKHFTKQAKMSIANYLQNVKKHNEKILDLNDDLIARAFYMDVFTLRIINPDIDKIFKSNNTGLMLIEGYHKRKSDKYRIYSETDVSKLSDLNKITNKSLEDGFEITDYKNLDSYKINEINNKVNFRINIATSINNTIGKCYKNINFKVHNVGQALCTSLSESKNPPFLYFDFGISEGENLFNRPSDMTIDMSQKPSIVISHIHKDHWYGITKYVESFECNWYIPKQDLGKIFQKRCAEIIISGGSVSYISSPINLDFGLIFTNGISKYNPKHSPKDKHDNGLAMKLKLNSKNLKDVNILISGDQRYDFIPENYLNKIDILVASHHGGEYSWSNRKDVYMEIPQSERNGIVIYSCGQENTYRHPSKIKDYERRGWIKSHCTWRDNDYIFK